jgi:hypothetical protein
LPSRASPEGASPLRSPIKKYPKIPASDIFGLNLFGGAVQDQGKDIFLSNNPSGAVLADSLNSEGGQRPGDGTESKSDLRDLPKCRLDSISRLLWPAIYAYRGIRTIRSTKLTYISLAYSYQSHSMSINLPERRILQSTLHFKIASSLIQQVTISIKNSVRASKQRALHTRTLRYPILQKP